MYKLFIRHNHISPLKSEVKIADFFFLKPGTTVASSNLSNPGGLISVILPNLFIIAGIIMFFLVVLGGFTIISSAGNPEQTQKGQQTLVGAIIGFVVIIISYWIVQIIETVTGIRLLNSGII